MINSFLGPFINSNILKHLDSGSKKFYTSACFIKKDKKSPFLVSLL